MKTIITLLLVLMLAFALTQCTEHILNPNNDWTAGDEWFDVRDGQSYNTVQIGDQIWMAEDLNYDSKGSLIYGLDTSNADIYGRLYLWETAQNVCPEGWHLPSDGEWLQLEQYIGVPTDELIIEDLRGTNEGGLLKETGTEHWHSPNEGGLDSYGFCVLPGGLFDYLFVDFEYLGFYGLFWTTADSIWNDKVPLGCLRVFDYERGGIHRYYDRKSHCLSVRCVKDRTQ
ncbi:MAG: FISUMP domain-containing protein [Bacteroidales bacterium]|nr:FISUMP domain-containing protein [Bacteroidales bacterium]